MLSLLRKMKITKRTKTQLMFNKLIINGLRTLLYLTLLTFEEQFFPGWKIFDPWTFKATCL